MPDVRGLSARDAMVALSRAGLRVRITGAGSVVSQTPAAGEPIDSGGRALIELRRAPDPPGGGGRR
jgi:beta-lactam-binding protein with PASTA domain